MLYLHSKVKLQQIDCFTLLFKIVNKDSLGLGLLVGQNTQFQDVPLGSGKNCDVIFGFIFDILSKNKL